MNKINKKETFVSQLTLGDWVGYEVMFCVRNKSYGKCRKFVILIYVVYSVVGDYNFKLTNIV